MWIVCMSVRPRPWRRGTTEQPAGPGFLAIELAKRGLQVRVETASVDFVVCRAAFKNFTEPVKALEEMRACCGQAVRRC
jgi:ubiquinone/menaquinone biosynthesis C-methylase UbiE